MDKVKLILRGSLLIKNASAYMLRVLEGKLTFPNPKYLAAVKTGRYIPPTLAPQLYFFKRRGSSIMVPKGLTGYCLKQFKLSLDDINDQTVAPKIDIKFTGTPRDYQEKAIQAVLPQRYGILEAGTGAGKTFCGIAIAAERKVKTLIIVHNKELLDQWVERFKDFTNVKKVGVIGSGKFDIQDITVGIINTVTKHTDNLKKEFGFVIFDEVHRAASPSYINVLNSLMPRYHLGLTATPFRSDGMTKALYRLVGPILHQVDRKHLEDTGAIEVPRIIRVDTDFFFKFDGDNYTKMMSALTSDLDRTMLIAEEILDEFKKYQEPIMVVSDRVSHCELLHEAVNGVNGIKAVLLHSGVKKKERTEAVQKVKSGEYNTLISTSSLLSEGFDAPDLNSLFLTTPIKFAGRLLQIVGRILRPSKGGKPRVYDFRDIEIPVLERTGWSRDRVYSTHGWK